MIFIILMIALGVRLIALTQNYVVANDGVLYIKMAQLFSTGEYHNELLRNYSYYAFFPVFILLFNKILGDWVLAGQLISVLFGTLTVIPLYLLGRRIFDEKIAFFGAFFYSINPDLVKYSTEVLRDIPFSFFFITAIWLGYKGIKDEKLILVGFAGLFIALSASLRLEGLALLVCLPAFFFWNSIKNSISWGKPITACGLLWAVPLSILILFGFLFAQKGINIGSMQMAKSKAVIISSQNKYFKSVEKEVEEKRFSQKTKRFIDLAIKHRFVLYASNIIYKTTKVFNILFLLFLFGLIKRRVVRYRPEEFLLFAIYAVFITVFFLYMNITDYLSTRHPFAIVTLSLIWCGVGFIELKERLNSWLEARDFQLKAMALRWLNPLILLLICIPLLSMAWAPQRKDKVELKEIGLWLKNNGHDHSIIAGQKEFSRLAFYAGSDFIILSDASYQDIVKYSRSKKADLLVINEKTIEHLSPNFFNSIPTKGLQQIHIPFIKTPKYATRVFQIKDLKE